MKQRIIHFLITIMAYLPLSVLRALGSSIGVIAMKFSKRSSKRLKANLIATGMCTEDEVDEMARKTAQELGKTLVETTCIAWHRSKEHNAKLIVKAINYDYMEQELLSGKPIVFLTPHISNFEIALKYTAYKISNRVFTVLYKPSKDEWFNQMMIDGRTEDNIKPVPTNRMGVFTLAKDLRAGGVIGVLPDSIASSGDGVWVEFFGKKVFATTLAAKMSMMPGAVTFIVATKRVKNGFEVNYIPFVPDTDITTVVQDIYKVIEKAVLEAPEQYYWSYDRFRVPNHASPIKTN